MNKMRVIIPSLMLAAVLFLLPACGTTTKDDTAKDAGDTTRTEESVDEGKTDDDRDGDGIADEAERDAKDAADGAKDIADDAADGVEDITDDVKNAADDAADAMDPEKKASSDQKKS